MYRLKDSLRPDQVSPFCRVDLEFPKVEVRFQNLKVEASVHVGSRALPTIPNFIFNVTEVHFLWNLFFIAKSQFCTISF